MSDIEVLLTEKHVARILCVSCSWLQKARCYNSSGPRWLRMGGTIRYRKSDIEKYMMADGSLANPTGSLR